MLTRALLIFAFTLLARANDFFSEAPATIAIQIEPKDMESLRADPRKFVPAEIHGCGKAEVRLKGSGTFQPIDEKPSLTVVLQNSKIHLNNSVDDPTALNEFIGSHLSRLAGMPVPRVSHALVSLNSRRLGLYVVKEAFDAPSIEPPRALDQIDLAEFCNFMAFETLVCHWDGYSLRANNFHASKGAAGRIIFRPAGMDQLFNKPDFNWKPDMTGALAREVMSTPPGRELYEQQFRKLFDSIFDAPAIQKAIDARVQQLKPLLKKSEFARLREEANELSVRIAKRAEYLRAQLAKKS